MWTMIKGVQHALRRFKHNRIICRPVIKQGVWRMRYNDERIHKGCNGWAIWKMDDSIIYKKISKVNLYSARKRGRRRLIVR